MAKHPSLFFRSISGKEKKFCNIDAQKSKVWIFCPSKAVRYWGWTNKLHQQKYYFQPPLNGQGPTLCNLFHFFIISWCVWHSWTFLSYSYICDEGLELSPLGAPLNLLTSRLTYKYPTKAGMLPWCEHSSLSHQQRKNFIRLGKGH